MTGVMYTISTIPTRPKAINLPTGLGKEIFQKDMEEFVKVLKN